MQRYPVRVDHRRNLTASALAELCRGHFGEAAADEQTVTTHWGAIAELKARAAGKELEVEVTMNTKVEETVAAETIRRYNQFLESVTGYSAKERARRLKKAAAPE